MSAQEPLLPLVKAYGDGLLDGFAVSLKLMLGIQPIEGGEPFGGTLPGDARAWAEKALAKVEAERSTR